MAKIIYHKGNKVAIIKTDQGILRGWSNVPEMEDYTKYPPIQRYLQGANRIHIDSQETKDGVLENISKEKMDIKKESITQEQLETEIVAQIKGMGMNQVFNEEFIDKVKKSVSERVDKELFLSEEVDLDEEKTTEEEGGENVESMEKEEVSGMNKIEYTPTMPSFIEKIEPEEFVIFDMNELSEGGVNLSNKKFRTFENPDLKKSIHQSWVDEGKKKAKVYVAKFEEIGCIEFDPIAGTSKFEERRVEKKSAPEEKNNPYKDSSVKLQLSNNEEGDSIKIDVNDINIEGFMRQYIEDALRSYMNNGFKMKPPKVEDPNQEVQKEMGEDEVEDDYSDIMESKESIENKVIYENNDLKISNLAMDDSSFKKIDAPKELVECLSDSEKINKLLVSKGKEVQELKFEGKSYFYPIEIISANKCYIKV